MSNQKIIKKVVDYQKIKDDPMYEIVSEVYKWDTKLNNYILKEFTIQPKNNK